MSSRVKGATSVSLEFRLSDASTGAAKPAVDVTALKLQFVRPGSAPSAATSLTLLGSQTASYTAYGAIEQDGVNSAGVYRVDVPNTAFATGADEVVITIAGTAIQPCSRLIDLLGVDLQSSSAYDGTLASATATTITFGSSDANAATATGRNITLIDQTTRASQATVVGTLVSGQTYTVAPPLASHAGTYDYLLEDVATSGGGGSTTDASVQTDVATALGTFFGAALPASPTAGSRDAQLKAVGAPAVLAALQPNFTPARAGDAMTLTAAYDPAKAAAQAAQIPAAFTAATFASPGVFAPAALAAAPTGTGGGGGISLAQLQGELDVRTLTAAELAAIKAVTDRLGTTLQAGLNGASQFTPAALTNAAGGLSLPQLQAELNARSLTQTWTANVTAAEAAIKADTGKVAGTVVASGGSYVFTPAALAAAPTGMGGGGNGINLTQMTTLLAQGVVLAPNGLDQVQIEPGTNARQALQACTAFAAGKLDGAGTGIITFSGIGVDTTRIQSTVDGRGDRTGVAVSLTA